MSVSLINPQPDVIRNSTRSRKKGRDPIYVSTCLVCRCGVYDTEPWKFYRQPTGISHVECVEGRKA